MDGPIGEWRFKTLEEREAMQMDESWEREQRVARMRMQAMENNKQAKDAYGELAKDMAQNGTGGVFLNREQRRKLKKAEKRLGNRIWG